MIVMHFRIGKKAFLDVDLIDFLYLNCDKKFSKSQLKRLLKDDAIDFSFKEYKK